MDAAREDTIRLSDGTTAVYAVMDTSDIALVIPAEGDRLHLVEKHRCPFAGRLWEFSSGNEDQRLDVDAATPERELEEQDMRSAWFTGADVERMINGGTITEARLGCTPVACSHDRPDALPAFSRHCS